MAAASCVCHPRNFAQLHKDHTSSHQPKLITTPIHSGREDSATARARHYRKQQALDDDPATWVSTSARPQARIPSRLATLAGGEAVLKYKQRNLRRAQTQGRGMGRGLSMKLRSHRDQINGASQVAEKGTRRAKEMDGEAILMTTGARLPKCPRQREGRTENEKRTSTPTHAVVADVGLLRLHDPSLLERERVGLPNETSPRTTKLRFRRRRTDIRAR